MASAKKEKCADAILGKVARQMKEEANLCPFGMIGQMMNQIQKLGLSFYYYQPIDIAEGRKLLIQAANAMLQEMNQDPLIRPYLGQYPMRPWNVEIEIFLRTPTNRDVPSNALRVITVCDGMLCYEIAHPKRNGFLTIYKETYQEALDRIADPTLPLAPFTPDPDCTPEEVASKRMQVSFVSDDGSIWHLGPNGAWIKDLHAGLVTAEFYLQEEQRAILAQALSDQALAASTFAKPRHLHSVTPL